MKNIIFLLLISSICQAQIKISELPLYVGNAGDAMVPVVISNTNRKVSGNSLSYNKIETITITYGTTYDTINVWKGGAIVSYVLTRAGGGGGGGGAETDPTFNSQFASKSTSNLAEGSNQYFTNTRARTAHSQGFGHIYNPATGVHSADTAALSASLTDSVSGEFFLKINGTLFPKLEKYNGDSKVVPDANYTITLFDEVIILPDPAATRTLTLPAASTMQKQEVTIYCAATTTGDWVLSGSYVQFGTTGSLAENFINSGIATGDRLRLVSVNDNGNWKWIDLK